MSAYEQRCETWMDEPCPHDEQRKFCCVECLTALCESIAAEARGQARKWIYDAAEQCERCGLLFDESDLRNLGDEIAAIRALAPRPDVRLVAREDLAHLLGTCGCVPLVCNRLPDVGRLDWPAAHTAAIDRLRAGEE